MYFGLCLCWVIFVLGWVVWWGCGVGGLGVVRVGGVFFLSFVFGVVGELFGCDVVVLWGGDLC